MKKHKRKPKTTSAYDALGNMSSEEIAQEAAKVFQGEMMTCVMCGRQQKSDPQVETDWRAIQVDETPYYACPDEFPPDGASKEEFSKAYQKVLLKVLRGRSNA